MNDRFTPIDRLRQTGCAPVFENGIDRIDWIAGDGALTRMNDAGKAALDGLVEELCGLSWIDLWAPESRSSVASHIALARANGSTRFSAASDLGGCRLWWDVVLSVAGDGMIAQARDVSDTLATMDEYRRRSRHDALTGLLNRPALRDTLALEIGRSEATGSTGAVLMLDLDNFKLINDTLGHDVGDQILQAVADGLREVVDDNGFSARLGGDEFSVVLSNIGNLDDLREIVEALLERLGRAVEIKGHLLHPRASIGAALFPKHGKSPSDLLRHADIALYAAKSFGRGGYVLFVPSMNGPIRRRAAAAAAVREALAENRVDAFYQPMIDLASGGLLGFEAKLHVILPDGLVMPSREVAACNEDVDLARAIGERVLVKVTDDAKRWRDSGLVLTHIAVNACAAEFRTGDYAERFLKRLHDAGLPPELFELEVAETVLASRGTDYVAAAIKVLSAAGVKILLDDFGTGPASLSHLKRLPVSGIKIDESFVDTIEHDANDGAIVRAMIGLANGFGIGLAADGVSTDGQARMLAGLGCKIGQGDLFGRASPAVAAASLLAGHAFAV
ncbi:EAL domain-containing protein [Sphingosinicellaceae bacterium]|nr:EAL domain-containing protein [Sphingosinicellaceae bacterium]